MSPRAITLGIAFRFTAVAACWMIIFFSMLAAPLIESLVFIAIVSVPFAIAGMMLLGSVIFAGQKERFGIASVLANGSVCLMDFAILASDPSVWTRRVTNWDFAPYMLVIGVVGFAAFTHRRWRQWRSDAYLARFAPKVRSASPFAVLKRP